MNWIFYPLAMYTHFISWKHDIECTSIYSNFTLAFIIAIYRHWKFFTHFHLSYVIVEHNSGHILLTFFMQLHAPLNHKRVWKASNGPSMKLLIEPKRDCKFVFLFLLSEKIKSHSLHVVKCGENKTKEQKNILYNYNCPDAESDRSCVLNWNKLIAISFALETVFTIFFIFGHITYDWTCIKKKIEFVLLWKQKSIFP